MSAGVIAASAARFDAYALAILALNPDLYLKLDESSGSVAADSSGNGRNGTYTNSPLVGQASLLTDGFGRAMGAVTNTGESAAVASAAWMNSNSLTVMGLVNLTSATDAGQGDGICSRYTTAGGFPWLIWRNTTGHWAFQVRNTGGTAYNIADPASVSLSTTYHVAAVFNSGANLTSLYVNGTSVASTATTGTLQTSTSPIEVARYSVTDTTTPSGTFDEWAVWGSALTAGQIANIAALR